MVSPSIPQKSSSGQIPGKIQRKEGTGLSHLWRSPWTTWIGFRYLKSKKNSRFLSFITLLSMFGVGLGVTAMIVVLSVMDGFETELKKRMMSSDLHVLVQPTFEVPGFDSGFVPEASFPLAELQEILPRVTHQQVQLWPIVSTEVILKSGRRVTGAVLKGVTSERLALLKKQVTEVTDPKREPSHLPGLFLGQELAYEMGMIPGDEVTLVSPTEMEGPLGNIPRLKRYVVEGVYHSGLPEQELHTLYATEAAVQSFLKKPGVFSQWEVTVQDFDLAPEVARQIRKLAPDFKVQDWMELNAHLFASLKLERLSMFVILAFIIIVASFNIVTTLTLMVLEKKRDIAILKAMGARDTEVAALFMAEGIFIGMIGVGGGMILGFVLCSLLKHYEFITLPDIYYDRTLPVTFNVWYYILVSLCALLIVFAACLYPSKRAARLNPLEGIRFG